ncbi:MAG: hypothetical protein VYD12_17010 [Pseudomonadota bacterium]|nr:hypothetical protein [Pseudomonadota bacterium]
MVNSSIPLTRQRAGGLAAFVCALCYVVGLVMIMAVMPDINTDADERLNAILGHSRLIQLWYLIIFVLFGIALLVLNRSLYQPAYQQSGHFQLLGALLGYMWAAYVFASGLIAVLTVQYLIMQPVEQVERIWPAIFAIQMGLGDGVEWVGGIWMLMVNMSMQRYNMAPKMVVSFGMMVGAIGALTLVPALAIAGLIFGLLQIVWFCWLGSLLLRGKLQSHSAYTASSSAMRGVNTTR